MKKIVLLVLLAWLCLSVRAQDQLFPVAGKVTAEGQPLPGAYLGLKNSDRYTVTDTEGRFLLQVPQGDHTLVVRFIGFQTHEMEILVPLDQELDLELLEDALLLEGVDIMATGYQEISKERATGSFVTLNQELVDRRVSTGILDRIEDVTPGIIFNRGVGRSTDKVTIRGRSTLFAQTQPLIILDNFPYDGPIDQINPNDIASITILRDAAAASIWGARAGNGVIVLTTKKGSKDVPLQVSFNANLTSVQKPDLFYVSRIGSSDFIDIEQQLFSSGFYNSAINSVNKTPLSPVVELLLAARNGEISADEAQVQIDRYRSMDIRQDQQDLFYRRELRQQYALNIRGGGESHQFYVSAGHDRNQESLLRNSLDRTTINSNLQLDLIPGKLRANGGVYLSSSVAERPNPGENALELAGSQPIPYNPLVDASGNPQAVSSDFSDASKSLAVSNGLLNWDLVPLQELFLLENHRETQDLRLNAAMNYDLAKGLTLEAAYQYWRNQSETEDWWDEKSYASRHLINRFTQSDTLGKLTFPVPMGGVSTRRSQLSSSHNLRLKVDYTKDWGKGTQLKALAGYEVKALSSASNNGRYYGVTEETGINIPVDYVNQFPQYINNRTLARIPYVGSIGGGNDNFISYFGNASYTWQNRYIASASARKDASNLFGVNANQKGVPLYSVGLSWMVSEEKFADWDWLPFWKFRVTYGVNGNVDKSITAFTTSRILLTSQLTRLPIGSLSNPANPNLQWETIKILNLGTDFSLWEDKLSGSFEYYVKNGENLIGDFEVAPSNGRTAFRGNFASTRTNGYDLNLQFRPFKSQLQWTGNFFLSHVNEQVTKYEVKTTAQTYLSEGAGLNQNSSIFPLEGRPLYAVYSLPWGGLDPANGNPRGFLDGELSTDYAAIINGATPESLTYHGPSTPRYFGAFRNQLDYKGFSLSVNISYRLGYYYKRSSVNYNTLLSGRITHGDFARRWKNPGDESITDVPSQPASRNLQRDNFYTYSSILVEKGDHIRLQDIRLGYSLNRAPLEKLPFRQLSLYAYANNLGVLWKVSEDELDPDFQAIKPMTSISVGLQIDF